MIRFFLFIMLSSLMTQSTNKLKIDFGADKTGQSWRVINDGVMGGLSQANAEFQTNSVLFQGKISLDNNGGFSSYRSPFAKMDFAEFESVSIRFKSKGPTFGFSMETSSYFYQPNYKAILQSESTDWQTLTFKLTDFKQYQLGRPTGERLVESDKAKIIRIGFINHDKVAESFELEIDYIIFE
ncbi:MAG: CIA30 family protein [Bacteroidia bacterium]